MAQAAMDKSVEVPTQRFWDAAWNLVIAVNGKFVNLNWLPGSPRPRGEDGSIKKMIEEQGPRSNADIRIYCDNDPMTGNNQRWFLVPDIPGPGANSQRAPEFREWEDTTNHIRAPIGSETDNCRANTNNQAYSISAPRLNSPTTEKRNRLVISLCHRTLRAAYPTFDSVPISDLRALGTPG
ncbi:hypothetical protein K402DRAFT_451074, partial [Aulographum hederae CBS 113979]